jgi:ClpP class serine protease
MSITEIFWLFFMFSALQPVLQQRMQNAMRIRKIAQLERKRKSRVILLVHRQETMRLLGFPVMRYIDVNDSEEVLRASHMTDDEVPLDIVLHTPGGLVLAALQIARAIRAHKGKVTVLVPHYAMSGGTLIALAADEIVMDSNAVLGQVDPQIGEMPAASIVKILNFKKPSQVSDEMLVLIDMAAKARIQVAAFVADILLKHYPKEKALELATILSEGRWTHDFPIMVDAARQLGLKVSTTMPRVVYELMDLYPQAGTGRPSVLYVPLRRPTKDQ